MRPAGLSCDTGAFEVVAPAATTRTANRSRPAPRVLDGSASNPDLLPATARLRFGPATAHGSNTASQAIAQVTPPERDPRSRSAFRSRRGEL